MRDHKLGNLFVFANANQDMGTVQKFLLYVCRKFLKKEKSKKYQDKNFEATLVKPGEHIFKGHRSYDLMRELQLGIMFSIANANKSRMALTAQDVTHESFHQKVMRCFCCGPQHRVVLLSLCLS